MFSHEKGYKIGAKVNEKGGNFFTNRLAWPPLLKISVTGNDMLEVHQKVLNETKFADTFIY